MPLETTTDRTLSVNEFACLGVFPPTAKKHLERSGQAPSLPSLCRPLLCSCMALRPPVVSARCSLLSNAEQNCPNTVLDAWDANITAKTFGKHGFKALNIRPIICLSKETMRSSLIATNLICVCVCVGGVKTQKKSFFYCQCLRNVLDFAGNTHGLVFIGRV